MSKFIKHSSCISRSQHNNDAKESIHKIEIFKKIIDSKKYGSHKLNQDWYMKKPDLQELRDNEHINEVVGSELMRFFIKNTPKYRLVILENGETAIISQKAGYDRGHKEYLPTDTLGGLVEKGYNIDSLKDKFIHAHAISALIGNVDLHNNNLIVVNNSELMPIDFGKSCLDLQNQSEHSSKLLYGLLNHDCRILGSRQDLFGPLQDIVNTYNERSGEIESIINETCDELQSTMKVTHEHKEKILNNIKNNASFITKQVEIYNLPIISEINEQTNLDNNRFKIQLIRSLQILKSIQTGSELKIASEVIENLKQERLNNISSNCIPLSEGSGGNII